MSACCSHCAPLACTCTTNFWILVSGDNQLKGCCCDEENPVVLGDEFIIYALQHTPKAWKDFWVLYPSLFPCEKERFDQLFAANPYLIKQVTNEQSAEDQAQGLWNKQGIHLNFGGSQQKLNLPPTAQPRRPVKCRPC